MFNNSQTIEYRNEQNREKRDNIQHSIDEFIKLDLPE